MEGSVIFFVNARAFIERIRDDGVEIVLQTRNKSNEHALELPGGRIEPYESIFDALRREVLEETGLTVTEVVGDHKRIDTKGINPEFEVECVEPYCVYQTMKGPIDSVGMYFRCKAEGDLLLIGDETMNIHWHSIEDVYRLMNENPRRFSDVDRAGLKYYLKHKFGKQLEEGRGIS